MFDLCAWRRCDARTLDAPSEVKANALTGWYNGKRQRRTTARGGSRGTIGRRPTCRLRQAGDPGFIPNQYEQKGAGVGNSRRDIPRCRTCSFHRNEVLAGLEPTGQPLPAVSRQAENSQVFSSRISFFIFRGDLFCVNVSRSGGDFVAKRRGRFWASTARRPRAARQPRERQNRPKSGVLQAEQIVTKLLRVKHQHTTEPLPTVGKGVGIP